MKPAWIVLFLAAALPLSAGEKSWPPTKDLSEKGKGLNNPTASGRKLEIFQHGVKPEWGYKVPQRDTFVVIHPRQSGKQAKLYVVLHSAGHDVISCVQCTRTVGNHDIYHSPDDFYALYLDCRANRGDWWWGGMHRRDARLKKMNSGSDPAPVEKRSIDTVKWVIEKYSIDKNRVYLCGNSMGGSGTLGIGMRYGDIFAAIKANVPAGIEHVSHRMSFPPQPAPKDAGFPDPPVVIDYSAQNDGWSAGHDLFAGAMNERRYALFFYWGPFGHANNHSRISKVNDLINSFDWLEVRKNESYPVFTNSSTNDKLPWPGDVKNKASGQINAFFRWKNLNDTADKLEISLFLLTPQLLETTFDIPGSSTADVSLRRIQNLQIKPGETFKWSFGKAKGEGRAGEDGLLSIAGLKITARATTLALSR